MDKPLCVMCGKPAEFIAKKTSEPLCEGCKKIDEAITKEK
jgi:hypothetical protein